VDIPPKPPSPPHNYPVLDIGASEPLINLCLRTLSRIDTSPSPAAASLASSPLDLFTSPQKTLKQGTVAINTITNFKPFNQSHKIENKREI
jgi:hypothetical protein